jgi:hypothetical protein
MISRSGNNNFLAAHYDWVAAGVGLVVLLLGVALFALSLGDDPDAAAEEERASIKRMMPDETGVKSVDMSSYEIAVRQMRNPPTVADVSPIAESFLASERRILCKGSSEKPCGNAIPGDPKLCPECPFCGAKQEETKKIVLDADADGLPDEWEKKYGLNTADAADANADTDGDGFTNAEEYAANTDPSDKKDHPDYLDSLKVVLPLKETYMPFIFIGARQVASGWRCDFFDASQKDDYGRQGRVLSAIVSAKGDSKHQEIGADSKKPSGYELIKYERKERKEARKGMKGMQVSVDASEATVVRKRDGKQIVLVITSNKRAKTAPVDVQATLCYERGGTKNMDVTPGTEIDLNGTKYKVVSIARVGNGAKVTIENVISGKQRILEALEQ